MSTDPPAFHPGRLRHWITDIQVSPDNTNPDCKFSARIFVDNELVCSLPSIDHTRPLDWSGLLLCDVSSHSEIAIRLCRSTRDRPRYFNFAPFIVSEVDEETGESTLELPEAAWVVTVKSLTPSTATQLYSDGLEKFNTIEGVYDTLEPNQNMKYLFKHALQFASLVAEALPGCTAKVSFLIYMKVWERLDQQTQIDDTVQTMLRALTRISDIIEIANQASSSMLAAALNQSKESVDRILALLEDASLYLFNRYTKNDLARIPLDGGRPEDTYDVGAYLARIEELQKEFYASWSPATAVCTDNPSMIEVVDSPRDDAQIMADEPTKADWYGVMNLLRPTNPSGYNPDQACMDGTREVVLNKIVTWTQNRENDETFMWISGQAGMGKTAIAASLCQRLDDVHALGGSFFFQGDDHSSNDPLTLISNLICELAMNCPPYAREVMKAIRARPKLCTSHLTLRYQGLVKKPLELLEHISTHRTLVMVVDGLDECGDHRSRGSVLHMLHEMSRLVPWLKVIVTGRPVGDMQKHFQISCPHGIVVHLQNYDASDDICAYIQEELGQLAATEDWPDDSFDKLCSMADGVFLWAARAVNHITEFTLPALPRLHDVLNHQKSPVTDYFDGLYSRVLKTAMYDNQNKLKGAYLQCIGAILAISELEPLAVPDLQHLLLVAGRIDQPTLEQITNNLRPLLLELPGERLRFHHNSFKNFITNSSCSGEFYIGLNQYDADPAACCLKVMQRDLRFNICKLETSHSLNSEVTDLKRRINTHIGPALKYACIHWVDHVIAAPNQALVEAIKELFEGPQLMYWIEVLSLLGCIDVGVIGLSKLALLDLTRFSDGGLISSWVKDTERFLLSNYDAISTSTPHLYVSALALSPSESLTVRRMHPYFPNTVSIARGDLTWHPCRRSIVHPHSVQSLSLSPDGLHIVAAYPDGSIALWNERTGSCINKSAAAHRDLVTCVVYSPKGDLIASSSHDGTIRVWDVASDLQTSHVLTGHSGPIHSVVFSPNAAIIASGSSDKTIRLWDPVNMCAIRGPYVGHSGRVSSMVFSPDGTKLASGSWDKTVRIWSVDLGGRQLAASPLIISGHSDSVTCLAFSPNGSKITSGSADKTIQIWDAATGEKSGSHIFPIKHSDTITSIAFSPNGQHIASSSLDGLMHIWNGTTSEAVYRLFGHSSPVNSITFSPDGSFIVSGSTDTTTRVWETVRLPLVRLDGHSSYVLSVAVSSNGTRIVSGSWDKKVRIWDAQTGTQIGSPCMGHSDRVYGVAISPDGAHVVSVSFDKTIKHWDMATHTNLHSHDHSHSIDCTAFSPNGALIAFGSEDKKVYVWDFSGWKMINQGLQGHSGGVLAVAFSPDGAYIASASGDLTVILWDVGTHSRSDVKLTGHTNCVASVAFSPCGTRLVSGSYDKTIRLWNRQTGTTTHTFTGHTHYVTSVAFSPDGDYIASGSYDQTVRLWNTRTGQAIDQPFTGHSYLVRSIAFSPDMSYLVSGSQDATIRVWSLEASYSSAGQTQDPPGAFCWPSNPYNLSSHPDRPGWVTHDSQSLVLWLPAHYQHREQFVGAASRKAFLDYSKFVHGMAWTEVASEPIRRNSQ